MNSDFRLLAIRALNYWRHAHPPGYLGIRLFLSQCVDSLLEATLHGLILRKLATRSKPRYQHFHQFKALDANGKFDYRSLYAASATTAIGEAIALDILSRLPSLANRSNVYSYNWPKSQRSGGLFTYFYTGYRLRNERVAHLLRQHPRKVALVLDIRQFYPSVSRQRISARFTKHLSALKDSQERRFLEATCSNFLSLSQTGIPMGPPLSHVLGNIALESVDLALSDQLGDCYTRYVDDIILVLERSEVARVEQHLSILLNEENLELHAYKRDEVDAATWVTGYLSNQSTSLANAFISLVGRISLFCWRFPEEFQALQQIFSDEGLPLPLRRFRVNARYPRYQMYLWSFSRSLARHGLWLPLSRSNALRHLRADALMLRTAIRGALEEALQEPLPARGMVRRWRIQRLRFLVTRGLYFIPYDELPSIRRALPNAPDLHDITQLLQALETRSAEPIMHLPGSAVSTFAAYYSEKGWKVGWRGDASADSQIRLDVLAILLSYGVVNWRDTELAHYEASDAEYLKFCADIRPKRRQLADYSFVDELRTLQLAEGSPALATFWERRFSDQEALGFEVFGLGRYGSS